jgi:hypothetical protein
VQDKVEMIDSTSLENLPIGVDGAAYQWTDLHGEGIPGILHRTGRGLVLQTQSQPDGERV